ncbi:MAG: ABC transporter ATP-binding protein [Thermotoga sp.]|nr:MAG: ABC transporter ATP-binding protein [Thermotoga sp.]
MKKDILKVENLTVVYGVKDKAISAVRDVSFSVKKGEFFGIAGESGCGKSTLAFSIIRLLPPNAKILSGKIVFNDKDLLKLSERDLREMRWKDFSIVFQSSMNSLNPVMKIKDQIYDTIIYHSDMSFQDLQERIKKLFSYVNISPKFLEAYPHQLSGGMKQRVIIAMALALNPKLVIMDEPTTALDVVIQRVILQEIDELRKKLGFSVIFITHDLSLLVEISDTVAIMYAGKIVEKSPSKELFTNPLHPYTIGLMRSFPTLTGKRKRMRGIPGHPPDLSRKIVGCAFFDRCPRRIEGLCDVKDPPLIEISSQHFVACHLYSKRSL